MSIHTYLISYKHKLTFDWLQWMPLNQLVEVVECIEFPIAACLDFPKITGIFRPLSLQVSSYILSNLIVTNMTECEKTEKSPGN